MALVVALGAGAGIGAGCSGEARESEVARGSTPDGSLLAVGDTGEPWGRFPELFEGQLSVGRAMQRDHAARPVDAVVLLGDNFYPDGLLEDEFFPRVMQNLVRPYCAFIRPTARLATDFRAACSAASPPPPIPKLLAAVGNHDLRAPESLRLQREEIPRWIENWEMPAADAPRIRELPGGLSLIFLMSELPWDDAATTELAGILSQTKGTWRVIVGHRPPIAGHPGLSKMVREASARAGRRVHVYLAGHVHVLGAIRREEPDPALTVIAGSGSEAAQQSSTEYEIAGADVVEQRLGFVRLESFEQANSPRLRVTLIAARPSPVLGFLGDSVVAEYEIDSAGDVRRRIARGAD